MAADLVFEKRGEKVDDLVHEAEQIVKRFNNRLTLTNLRLAERYVEGELRVLVKLLPIRDGNLEERIAVFHRKLVGGPNANSHLRKIVPIGNVRKSSLHPSNSIETPTLITQNDRGERLVLIGNVESMQSPETVVSSFVGFEKAHFLENRLREACYLSTFQGLIGRGVRLADWESRVVGNGSTIALDEMADQMVECGTEIVQGVTNQNSPFDREGDETLDPAIDITGLRVLLGDDFWGAGFPKSVNPAFKVADVLVGPLGFQSHQPLSSCIQPTSGMEEMNEKKKQQTPRGYEIPVPKKGEFFDNLEKASKPSPPEKSDPDTSREKKKR